MNLNKVGLKTVNMMKPGDQAKITGFTRDDTLSIKLMEMGCIPGTSIRYNFKAPLGDPICVSILGYELSLRLEEAALITITEG